MMTEAKSIAPNMSSGSRSKLYGSMRALESCYEHGFCLGCYSGRVGAQVEVWCLSLDCHNLLGQHDIDTCFDFFLHCSAWPLCSSMALVLSRILILRICQLVIQVQSVMGRYGPNQEFCSIWSWRRHRPYFQRSISTSELQERACQCFLAGCIWIVQNMFITYWKVCC